VVVVVEVASGADRALETSNPIAVPRAMTTTTTRAITAAERPSDRFSHDRDFTATGSSSSSPGPVASDSWSLPFTTTSFPSTPNTNVQLSASRV